MLRFTQFYVPAEWLFCFNFFNVLGAHRDVCNDFVIKFTETYWKYLYASVRILIVFAHKKNLCIN